MLLWGPRVNAKKENNNKKIRLCISKIVGSEAKKFEVEKMEISN